MNYILFDGSVRNQLLPFTYTRPVADIRVGILTIREKWEKMLGFTTSTITEDYLIDKFPMIEMEQNIFINDYVFISFFAKTNCLRVALCIIISCCLLYLPE